MSNELFFFLLLTGIWKDGLPPLKQESNQATKGEMYLHSEELFFHPENSFVSILGCFYGYHLLTRREVALNGKSHSHLKCPNFSETLNMHDGVESKPVQGKMLGQVHDLTLPIMDGTCTFWCVYFLHVNSLLIFFVSVCIYDWFIGSKILKYCHFSTELDLPSEGKIDRSSYNRVP